jgi:hypothetical protein
MPTFSSYNETWTAKGRCVRDGEFYKTDSGAGTTVPVIPSTFSAFAAVPKRSGTGVWSVKMRDPAFRVLNASVRAFTTTANAVDVIMQPNTNDATTGALVINWTFVTVGTTTPVDLAASQVFNVFVDYSEASIA